MEKNWHLTSVEETLSALNSTQEGLSDHEAKIRLLTFGLNKLTTKEGPSLFKLFFHQFLNPLILILVVASCIKFFVANFLDGGVLLSTIFIMALISFLQELKAEKAMRALKQLTAHRSKVKRNGKLKVISSEHLVPGDLLILEMGDKVAADARLIEVKNLKIDESMFTGESLPSEKQTSPLDSDCVLADRKNMVYAGTVVGYGKAIAIVTNTAMSTEIGKIAFSIQEIKPERTPLQKSIQTIGNWMLVIVFFAILLFAAISFYRGMPLIDVFLLGVAAAVSAIPEGLPAAFTITLALGMNVMAKRNAIIRKLIAVETLGSTTAICSDKTGTLTLNQMTVKTIYAWDKMIEIDKGKVNLKKEPIFQKILEIGALCNDAQISKKHDSYEMVGDPTEGALLVAAAHMDMDLKNLSNAHPRIGEIPFISENLYMATLHQCENKYYIYVKGAPERILAMCSSVLTDQGPVRMDEEIHRKIQQAIEEMTQDALRLIAVAYCELDSQIEFLTDDLFHKKLVFAGIFGMFDPPRQEAIQAISLCKQAGIRVIMITGDNQMTAAAIGKELGISSKHLIIGKELKTINDEELQHKIKDTSIFARVEPAQKLRIVRAFQKLDHVVAMTGDGVNDAPALEAADIGIAMGKTGTDVAKEASDMILADDRFDSIVAAVEEGRAIFNRLRNACAFLLATCIGELFGLILSVFFTGLAPLIPLQILWINLISGSLVAIPLGLEPKMGNEMQQPPRDPSSQLIYKGMIYRIAYLAFLLGLGSFLIFKNTYLHQSLEKARTMVLCSLVAFEWLIAIKMRSEEIPLRKIGLFKNWPLLLSIGSALCLHLLILYIPFFQELFHTAPLSWKEWALVVIPGVSIFILETLRKEWFPTLFSAGKWKKAK